MKTDDSIIKLKNRYEIFRKKYKLPDFEKINAEFDLYRLKHLTLKSICDCIFDKLIMIKDNLRTILEPNESIHSIVESKSFAKEEIDHMVEFYKKIYMVLHQIAYTVLEDEKTQAQFIKEFWREWPEIKEKQKKILKRMIDVWKNLKVEKFSERYVQ
ncbi:MAG: hypothetical protein QW625_00055 [Candidatus Nanoarchaeia archaeon]